MNIVNKNVLVTGGSDGIGRALVNEFLQQGATNVVILDVVEFKPSDSFVDQTIFIKTDVSDAEQVRQSFREAITRLGHLDIVVANAGVFNELDPLRTVQVNLLGIMNTNYAAIEYMCKSKGGRGGVVLNNASILGLDFAHSAPAYVATKHGVIGFTRCLGDDYYFNKHGIKFLTFCPGFTVTTMTTNKESRSFTGDRTDMDIIVKQMGVQKPEELAELVVALADGEKVKNGSIWMVNAGKATEVEPKIYWKNF